jgi:hypothetical protein
MVVTLRFSMALVIGSNAIPALRQLLFERDRAGIFQPRRSAIQALAALEALRRAQRVRRKVAAGL